MFDDFDLGGVFDKGLEIYKQVEEVRHRGHPKNTTPAVPLANAPGQIPTGVPATGAGGFTIAPMWIGLGAVALVALVFWSRRK